MKIHYDGLRVTVSEDFGNGEVTNRSMSAEQYARHVRRDPKAFSEKPEIIAAAAALDEQIFESRRDAFEFEIPDEQKPPRDTRTNTNGEPVRVSVLGKVLDYFA